MIGQSSNFGCFLQSMADSREVCLWKISLIGSSWEHRSDYVINGTSKSNMTDGTMNGSFGLRFNA